MVSRIAAEAGDTVTNAELSAFLSLATREQQLIYVMDRGVAAQVAYNTTDPAPDPLINKVAVVPSSSGMAAQMAAKLLPNAPTMTPYAATTDFGVGETPLALDPGDSVTNAELNAFLGLTLAGQVVFLASGIQSTTRPIQKPPVTWCQ
jgi:hypothetical protein